MNSYNVEQRELREVMSCAIFREVTVFTVCYLPDNKSDFSRQGKSRQKSVCEI